MKNILLLIHSASHPIYQNNIEALVNGYKATIDRYKLNIDIVTFGGASDNPNQERKENIIFDIDEKRVADTLFAAIDMYTKHNYDIIVKTNTNTVVNLQLLCDFCNSDMFEDGVVYSNLYMTTYGDSSNVIFPSGMFVMADKNTWKSIVEKYHDAIEYTDANFPRNVSIRHLDNETSDRLVWTGYSDEFIIGVCIMLSGNIHLQSLPGSSLSSSKHTIFDSLISWGILKTDINTNYIAINCKLDSVTPETCGDLILGSYEEKFRTLYEHVLITAICRVFEYNISSYPELMYVRDTKVYYQ